MLRILIAIIFITVQVQATDELKNSNPAISGYGEAQVTDKVSDKASDKSATINTPQKKISKKKRRRLSRKKVKSKIKKLEIKLKKNKEDKELNFQLGGLYAKLKKWDKSIEHYKKSNIPTNARSLEKLGEVFEKKGDYLEQIRAYELLIVEKPKYPKAYVLLGGAYVNAKKNDKAVENYKKAIKIAPQYETAYEGILKVYEAEKNFYESSIVILDLINKFGQKMKWLTALCRIKTDQNYFEDAKLICQKAVIKGPKYSADNHVHLGLAYKFTNKPQQAKKIILSAGNMFPNSEFAQYFAGQFSDETRNWEAATRYYKQCVVADKTSPRCWTNLAKAEFELGRYDRSLASFSEACKLDNTVDRKIRTHSSVLRNKNQNKWSDKFKRQVDKCSALRFKKESIY